MTESRCVWPLSKNRRASPWWSEVWIKVRACWRGGGEVGWRLGVARTAWLHGSSQSGLQILCRNASLRDKHRKRLRPLETMAPLHHRQSVKATRRIDQNGFTILISRHPSHSTSSTLRRHTVWTGWWCSLPFWGNRYMYGQRGYSRLKQPLQMHREPLVAGAEIYTNNACPRVLIPLPLTRAHFTPPLLHFRSR